MNTFLQTGKRFAENSMMFFHFLYRGFLIMLLLLILGMGLEAQDCTSKNTSFKSGEEISYVISYDWFVIWTDVGELTVSAKDTVYQNVPAYKYEAVGETYKSWNWIFKVKDEFSTLVDRKTLKPLYSKRIIRENKYRKYDNYQYNFKESAAYAHVSKDNLNFKTDTLPINSCTFDIMSALLYARNINFSDYAPGDTIPLTILLDRQLYPIYFRYLGIEDYKMKHVGIFECIKFQIMLIGGDMFEEGDEMLVWATNDQNRIVVYAESPILVGSVKATLKGVKNNRYPLKALKKRF